MSKYLVERFKKAAAEIWYPSTTTEDEVDDVATACSTICLEEMGKVLEWAGENGYTKHQVNDRWYDAENFIGTTPDLLSLYETQVLNSINK